MLALLLLALDFSSSTSSALGLWNSYTYVWTPGWSTLKTQPQEDKTNKRLGGCQFFTRHTKNKRTQFLARY